MEKKTFEEACSIVKLRAEDRKGRSVSEIQELLRHRQEESGWTMAELTEETVRRVKLWTAKLCAERELRAYFPPKQVPDEVLDKYERKMAEMRALTADEVQFSVIVTPCDLPLKGNIMASGDDSVDEEVERLTLAELANGNVWAWCDVKVQAEWNGIAAANTLGACSYDCEGQFLECDYFADMKAEALRALNAKVAELAGAINELVYEA